MERGDEPKYGWWSDPEAIAEHERLRQQFKREQEAFNTEMWELDQRIKEQVRAPVSME